MDRWRTRGGGDWTGEDTRLEEEEENERPVAFSAWCKTSAGSRTVRGHGARWLCGSKSVGDLRPSSRIRRRGGRYLHGVAILGVLRLQGKYCASPCW